MAMHLDYMEAISKAPRDMAAGIAERALSPDGLGAAFPKEPIHSRSAGNSAIAGQLNERLAEVRHRLFSESESMKNELRDRNDVPAPIPAITHSVDFTRSSLESALKQVESILERL
jgi:hypothetical protein